MEERLENRKEVDWEHKHPDGAVLHAAAFDSGNNFCVADIWESEERLNNFINNRTYCFTNRTYWRT
jgi:hypothetical protein